MQEENRVPSDDVEKELVVQAINRDKGAFNKLVLKYQPRIYGYVKLRISDMHAIDDIAQETFITAYRSLDRCKNPGNFKGWLFGIANNFCLKWTSKRKRHSHKTIEFEDVHIEDHEIH